MQVRAAVILLVYEKSLRLVPSSLEAPKETEKQEKKEEGAEAAGEQGDGEQSDEKQPLVPKDQDPPILVIEPEEKLTPA